MRESDCGEGKARMLHVLAGRMRDSGEKVAGGTAANTGTVDGNKGWKRGAHMHSGEAILDRRRSSMPEGRERPLSCHNRPCLRGRCFCGFAAPAGGQEVRG